MAVYNRWTGLDWIGLDWNSGLDQSMVFAHAQHECMFAPALPSMIIGQHA